MMVFKQSHCLWCVMTAAFRGELLTILKKWEGITECIIGLNGIKQCLEYPSYSEVCLIA